MKMAKSMTKKAIVAGIAALSTFAIVGGAEAATKIATHKFLDRMDR